MLAKGEWDISVLDHVLDLSAHRQDEENDPVHAYDENGPEHGNVEDFEPAADERDGDGPRSRVPELELGQTPYEGPELLILLCGQRHQPTFLELFLLQGWVEFRCQEGQE